jgi:hypothetical protein
MQTVMSILIKKSVVVIDNNTKQIILKGQRDPATRLWLVPIVQQQIQLQHKYKFKIPTFAVPHAAKSAYHQKTISNLIQFLHATAGSPPEKAWCKAIDNNNFFLTWPGLTSQAVQKHLPKSEATAMGQRWDNDGTAMEQRWDSNGTAMGQRGDISI